MTAHRIGNGSSYDVYMNDIEMFVKHFKNPEDTINTSALFNYYLCNALKYWSALKDKIQTEELLTLGSGNDDRTMDEPTLTKVISQRTIARINKYFNQNFNEELSVGEIISEIPQIWQEYNQARDAYSSSMGIEDATQLVFPLSEDHLTPIEKTIGKVPKGVIIRFTAVPQTALKYLREHTDEFEQEFLKMLEEYKEAFTRNGMLDKAKVNEIFSYLARLACLDIGLSKQYGTGIPRRSSIPNYEGIYLLTNTIGDFGFNTWLYAFLQNIDLVGIPSDNQAYDDMQGCPGSFLFHDLEHLRIINERSIRTDGFKTSRKIYHTIITSDISKHLKELLILALWFELHETIRRENIYHTLDTQEYIETFFETLSRTPKNLIAEYSRFTDIVDTPEIREQVYNLYVNHGKDAYYPIESSEDGFGRKLGPKSYIFFLATMYTYMYTITKVLQQKLT